MVVIWLRSRASPKVVCKPIISSRISRANGIASERRENVDTLRQFPLCFELAYTIRFSSNMLTLLRNCGIFGLLASED
jgi:hypothetical protein